MKFPTTVCALALGLASATELHRCGTDDPTAKVKTELDKAYEKGIGKIGKSSDIVVDTYVNVVTTTAKADRYTPDQIHQQVHLHRSMSFTAAC